MSLELLPELRIVEIGHATTEYAGKILAELGAQVVLVEPPGGAATRERRPYASVTDASRRSIPFLARNNDKRSVVFDPASAEDEAAMQSLLAASDVLLAPPDSPFDAWLDGANEIARVEVSDVDGIGAAPLLAFAASGGLASSGWPEQPPCNAPSWLAHDAAGIYVAILALLAHREGLHGGPPSRYEVPLREAAIAGITPWTRPLHSYEQEASGQGIAHRRLGAAGTSIFPCADGYVRALTGTARQWRAFGELLGNPESLAAEEWKDRRFRLDNLETLYHLAAELTQSRKRRDLFERGQALGLTITPVYTMADLMADRHVVERGLFVPLTDPDLGPVQLMREPVKFEPPLPRRDPQPAPALGQDQASIDGLSPRPARPARDVSASVARPLEGLRVLNLGVGAVVPEAAELLALLGAMVIKVESRRRVDFLRLLDLNGSAKFNQLNLGVLSLAVDMTTEAGRAVVHALVPQCDIVMENMRAPVVTTWGCDYESVRALRPDVIYFSSQGLGHGPYGDFQTYGPNLQAFSGITASWAHPDDPYAVGTTLNHPDHVAGKQALLPILAALMRREATGEGAYIEGAQYEVAAGFIADKFLQEQVAPGSSGPTGNRSPDFAPHGVYPCAGDDRWCAIAVTSEAEWAALRAEIGELWADDGRYETLEGRLKEVDAIDEAIANWTRAQEPQELERRLRSAGVPVSRVVIGEDMASAESDHASGFFAALDHPTIETRYYTGLPFRDGAGRRPALRRPPLLGEHTEYVLFDLLGLDPEEVNRLMAERAVGW